MLLALFGTNPYPFERLVVFLERMALEKGYEIVVQHGSSRPPVGCHCFDYTSHNRIIELMEKADAVVAQGGYGSSLDALAMGRPLVLVPRLREMSESLDDQDELVKQLTTSGRALSARTYPEFASAIEQALSTQRQVSADQEQSFGRAVAQAILDFLEKNERPPK
ncbi:glycosyltransferase [Donghicola eburneus]|uniref:glycosyltransferase n=1 Tax=Donghicola eburneus TaxID=393278 RepID=UPI0008E09394|nr:glycosyltransferase [Donghicola eburneus]SFQ78766.1 UDP-N-acetylglucosamine transferase subunit ALG13 [Donghicola eburneus]